MNQKADKMKALETAIGQIERQFGKGSLMRMGEKPKIRVNVIPSGSLTLDAALGIGGIPRGRVIEIYGPESSGKTTLALHAMAEAQKAGAPTLNYGMFIQTVVDFVIVAWAVFLLVKGINALRKKEEAKPAEPPKPSEEVVLLREIRDAVSK